MNSYQQRSKSVEERWWEKVEKHGPDGCWEWTGAKSVGRDGFKYGSFRVENKTVKAHRFGYELLVRSLQDGEWVLHKCDNPICCNPDHLFVGNHTANMRDASAKGRLANQRKTHCPQGHPYDVVRKDGKRICRTCDREQDKLRKRRYRQGKAVQDLRAMIGA